MAFLQRAMWSLAIALPAAWAVGAMGWGAWQLVRLSDINVAASDIALSEVAAPAVPDVDEPEVNAASSGRSIPFAGVASASPSGLFSYGGSTAWAALRPQVETALQESRPDFQLRYVDPVSGPPGSRSGIRMLLDGRLTFAQTSHPLEDNDYALANQRNLRIAQIPVAIDGIAVVVRPDLAVKELTIGQLRDIYSNRIQNWKQVGGPDLKIVPFSRPPSAGGTVSFFVDEVLSDRPLGENVQLVPTTTQALRRLQGVPGGIYYASAPVVIPQCGVKALPIGREPGKSVYPAIQPAVNPEQCPNRRDRLDVKAFRSGRYPLTRYLYVVTAEPQAANVREPSEQAGETFAQFVLSKRGQDIVETAGFVRIR